MDDMTTETPAEGAPAVAAPAPLLKTGIEAILFTCDEPVTLNRLKDIFPEAKPDEIREAVAALKAEYDGTGRAFSLEEIAGGGIIPLVSLRYCTMRRRHLPRSAETPTETTPSLAR